MGIDIFMFLLSLDSDLVFKTRN